MSEGRERWDSRTAFIMAAVGSAVGLGNVWRFPYRAYEGGGGAFLVPYFVALLTAGIPLMILEYGLGRRYQAASPQALRAIHKRFEWVGWWPVVMCIVVAGYYCVIMAWCWNYLWYSLTLAWNGSAWGQNASDFFFKDFLHFSGNVVTEPTQLGGFNWPVLIPLALTWLLVYWIIVKGVSRVSKVVMWTVPLPILCLLILLVRGVTLEGAGAGIQYYLTPDFDKLFGPDGGAIWMGAYAQIFFSLSVGWGILIAYSSYMPRKSDVTNNAIITSLANCGVSFLAGFVVFSIVGHLAHVQGVEVEDAVAKSFGLAFVAYPTAISAMPGGPIVASIFGILFFFMLLTLGIDSAFSMIEAALGGVNDKFRLPRRRICAWVCLTGFLMGCFYLTYAGLAWLDIVDNWINFYAITLIALMECLIVGWFWKGKKEFKAYINNVSEIKIGFWWDACIMVITPVILIVSLIQTTRGIIAKGYEGYSQEALNIGGWGLSALCLVAAITLMFIRGHRKEEPAEAGLDADWEAGPAVASERLIWTRRNLPLLLVTVPIVFGLSRWTILPANAWYMLCLGVIILYVGLFLALRVAMKSGKRAEAPADEDLPG